MNYKLKYNKYKTKYLKLREKINLIGGVMEFPEDKSMLKLQLFGLDKYDNNGMSYIGRVYIDNVYVELIDTGYNIIGNIINLYPNENRFENFFCGIKKEKVFNLHENIIKYNINFFTKYCYNLKTGIREFIGEIIKNYINIYLKENNFNNLICNFYEQQYNMLYICCKNNLPDINPFYIKTDTTFKLHISCKINYWKECYYKLLTYFNDMEKQSQSQIHSFKFPLLLLKHVIDYRTEDYKKYYEWDGGTAEANFVIYFKKSIILSQFDYITEFLADFIPYWIKDDFDKKVKRDVNTMMFNERLTDTLFMTYDVDTNTKKKFYDKNKLVSIYTPAKIKDIDGLKFTMSAELEKEKKAGCRSQLQEEKKNLFNMCLKDKYNFDLSDLCKDTISLPHSWITQKNKKLKTIEYKMYPRCYDKI